MGKLSRSGEQSCWKEEPRIKMLEEPLELVSSIRFSMKTVCWNLGAREDSQDEKFAVTGVEFGFLDKNREGHLAINYCGTSATTRAEFRCGNLHSIWQHAEVIAEEHIARTLWRCHNFDTSWQ